ncbi:MAG: hypothetical protein KKB50_00240 [Planctomycetes bacterium]|nr:hypothetical protein [Planctomycetota bacterium]
MKRQPSLLVSIRGKNEALAAAQGGAMIADVEYPASALGTPYPLNIWTVRAALNQRRLKRVLVSTNIGELQSIRASACQAALGVAVAGADLIKFGLAGQSPEAAAYLAGSIVRTVRKLAPGRKQCFPAVFVDEDLSRWFKPFEHGPDLVTECKADGLLIDTFNKLVGKGLLDYCSLEDIGKLVEALHRRKKQAWVAGSISLDELPGIWATGVDVVCVRGAACAKSSVKGRFGEVDSAIVRELVATIP